VREHVGSFSGVSSRVVTEQLVGQLLQNRRFEECGRFGVPPLVGQLGQGEPGDSAVAGPRWASACPRQV